MGRRQGPLAKVSSVARRAILHAGRHLGTKAAETVQTRSTTAAAETATPRHRRRRNRVAMDVDMGLLRMHSVHGLVLVQRR